MTPVAHLLWSSVWAGVAAGVGGAGAAVHPQGGAWRARPRRPRPTSIGRLASSAPAARPDQGRRADPLRSDPTRTAAALSAFDFQTEITLLKVEASELALSAVMSAMRTCGLSGYRNDGAASQGRALRDILSAPIMINNDRILANLGASAVMAETPRSLFA